MKFRLGSDWVQHEKSQKRNVTIKIWDLGGQRRFRTMWERYCRGVSAIVYFQSLKIILHRLKH